MGRLWQSGFELNSTTAGVEWTTVTGGTIQTGTSRGDTYAGQITSLSSLTAKGFEYQFAAAAGAGPYYLRAYINIATLPSAANTILVLNNATGLVGTPEASIKLDNTGALTLFNGLASQVGSASSALSTNAWHSIELWFDKSGSAGTNVLKARLDGVEFASASNLTIALGVLSITLGGNLNTEAQTTGNWFFDDVAINDSSGTSQNSYPGEGKIVHMHPTGAGDNTAWAIFAGSSNWNAVSEVTPNGNTSAVQSLTGGQLDDYAMTVDAGIGSTDTISVIAVGVYYEGTAASANSKFRLRLKASSGGTVTETADIDPTSTAYVSNSKTTPLNYPLVSYFQPGTSTPWTKAALGTSQIGLNLNTASTNRARISTEWMSVDFTPAAVNPSPQVGTSSSYIHPGSGVVNMGRFAQSPLAYGGQIPNVPSSLIVNADNEYRTVLQWVDNSAVPYAATNFIVERSTDGVNYSQIDNVNTIYDIDISCSPSTTYYYRVKARNSYGDSAYITSSALVTPIAGQPWTAKIQGWISAGPYSSPIADYADGRTIDTLKPEYATVTNAGDIQESDAPGVGPYAFSPANGYSVKSYSNNQFITVSANATGFHALMADNTGKQAAGITLLTNFVVNNGFTGIELDWEGYSSWSNVDYVTFQSFLTTLRASLNGSGKLLSVVGPPIGDQNLYSDLGQHYYQFRYEDIAPLVDYICVLAYDYEFDYGSGTPVQPTGWAQAIALWMIQKVGWANRSKIIVGMPSYGYHGTTGGYSITLDAYQQSTSLTGFSTATRDASSNEMMWANAGTSYVYQDVTSLNAKRKTLEDMGILNVSVWYLGGNLWFNGRQEPQVSTTHIGSVSNSMHPGLTPNSIARFMKQVPAYSALSSTITSTQNQTGISRITAIALKTQTGKSRIATVSPQTIIGKSRIQIATPQVQTGKGRITATALKTVQGISRVTITTLQTILGKSRITTTTVKTQTGKSRIQISTSQTILGKSRVTNTSLQTISGKSRVTALSSKLQTGLARIGIVTTKTQTGISRIAQVVAKTQLGVARVTKTVARSQTGVANIGSVITSRTQTGLARIGIVSSATQLGKSRITQTVSKVQTGLARITTTTLRTQLGRASILKTTTNTQLGKSRITVAATRSQTGLGRVTNTTLKTQLGISRVSRISTQVQLGKGTVAMFASKTQTGKASLANLALKIQSGLSRIRLITTHNLLGKSAVVNTNARVQTGVANVIRVNDHRTKPRVGADLPRPRLFVDSHPSSTTPEDPNSPLCDDPVALCDDTVAMTGVLANLDVRPVMQTHNSARIKINVN